MLATTLMIMTGGYGRSCWVDCIPFLYTDLARRPFNLEVLVLLILHSQPKSFLRPYEQYSTSFCSALIRIRTKEKTSCNPSIFPKTRF